MVRSCCSPVSRSAAGCNAAPGRSGLHQAAVGQRGCDAPPGDEFESHFRTCEATLPAVRCNDLPNPSSEPGDQYYRLR